jgi:hypothetical protein
MTGPACVRLRRRCGEREDLLAGEQQQHPDRDQPIAAAAYRELRADADQEQHAGEDDVAWM